MSDWVYITGGREFTAVKLGGVNVWKHDWTPLSQDPISVKDPLYGQGFRFPVYTITYRGRTILFAAGEFSSGMWGFFQPQS
jgi:hypothetical protein